MKYKKKSQILFFLGLLLFFISGCQSEKLAADATEFTLLQGEYSFQMPENWTEMEDATIMFTQDTLYGAQDSGSLSYLMIRGHAAELLTDADQLAEFGEELFGSYYNLAAVEQNSFEVGDYLGQHYRLTSTFERRDAWLDIYLVSVENAVVEFQFYSPIDRSAERRQELFLESVSSLKVETASQPVEAETTTAAVGEAIAEDYRLKMSTYQVLTTESENLLVLRYIFTNTGNESLIPAAKWDQAAVVSQNDQILTPVETVADSEISYLIEQGAQALSQGQQIEGAAVYQLISASEEVTLDFETDLFLSYQTTILPLGGN